MTYFAIFHIVFIKQTLLIISERKTNMVNECYYNKNELYAIQQVKVYKNSLFGTFKQALNCV